MASNSSADRQHLIERACQGDPEAYGQLFMNYYVALVRYAWPMLGVQEDAEDAVHDAFLKSWQRLDRFDGRKGQYSTWIFAITRNCCLDRLRQRKRLDGKELSENVAETRTADPAAAALRNDCCEEVFVLLSRLSDAFRETLVLHYWNEMSVKEIADVTQTSASNVKSRLSRGRTQLADMYRQRHGYAEEAGPSAGFLRDLLPAGLATS